MGRPGLREAGLQGASSSSTRPSDSRSRLRSTLYPLAQVTLGVPRSHGVRRILGRRRRSRAHIQAESATATDESDLEGIRALIRGFPGGFDTLNAVVKQRLRRWFESKGGIKAVATLRPPLPLEAPQGESNANRKTLPW